MANTKLQMALPAAAAGLTEATSVAIAQQIQWVEVRSPLGTVATSYVCQGQGIPIVLLPGFDSSLFEFRRLIPELAQHYRVYAVDLLGFGFCDRTGRIVDNRTGRIVDNRTGRIADNRTGRIVDNRTGRIVDNRTGRIVDNRTATQRIDPEAIKQHLHAFC
ncbi:MAG: alpha/beta fold hydrolase, partial [Phormidesmis sp.]